MRTRKKVNEIIVCFFFSPQKHLRIGFQLAFFVKYKIYAHMSMCFHAPLMVNNFQHLIRKSNHSYTFVGLLTFWGTNKHLKILSSQLEMDRCTYTQTLGIISRVHRGLKPPWTIQVNYFMVGWVSTDGTSGTSHFEKGTVEGIGVISAAVKYLTS